MLDALYDSPIRLVSCRHEQGAANAAEAYGKLTGRPGICLVTRGPGRDAGSGRRAHGEAGLDADAAPRRPGAARVPRPRGVAGARLRAGLRRHREGGVGGRQRRADPRAHGPRVLARALRPARARSCSRCPRTCSPRRPTSRTRRPSRSPRAAPRDDDLGRLRELLAAARAPARRRRRGRLDAADRGGRARVLRGERAPGRVRVPLPGLRRQPLAELRRRPRCRDGRGASPARLRDADLVLAIGGRLGEVPTRRYTLVEPPRPRQTLDPRPSGARASSASSTRPTCAIVSSLPEFAAALRERRAGRVRAGASGRRPRAPTTRRTSGTSRWRATSTSARSWRSSADGFLRRRDPDVRRGQLHRLGAPLRRVHAVRHAGRARARGSMGYGRRGGRRGASSSTRSAIVALLHGRRRLRHELARARDRGAVRPADRRAPRQQRHVRDDPHAPGAHVPRARDRHRSRESRLPRARAGVRRRTASGSSGPRTSRPRSSARSPPGSPRCSSCRSTRSGSARGSG